MKITVENKYRTVIIEEPDDDMDAGDFAEMIKDVMLAVTYHPNSIRRAFANIADMLGE